MTDDNDLVKRLLDGRNAWKTSSDEYERLFHDARLRAEDAEAKLAKTVKALDKIAGKVPYADDPYDIARAALAELKGDKP